jgi:hypothetical protein
VFGLTGVVMLLAVAAFRVDKVPLEVPLNVQPKAGD